MNGAVRILSTKKLQQNQKQFLLNAGMAVVEADFIRIRYSVPELANIKEYLVFTSQNAVKSILDNPNSTGLQTKGCYCVGAKTKALLEHNGFRVMAFAENAADLAEELVGNHKDKSFTFFSGSIRSDELPLQLANSGIDFNEIVVYETLLSPVKIKAGYHGILFFSPSGVESYLKENTLENRLCFCIGNTTAMALEKFAAQTIIANQPTVESTIVKCINHYTVTQANDKPK